MGELLVRARAHGVPFGDVLTVGRLRLRIPPYHMRQLVTELGIAADWQTLVADRFADDFFVKVLGARSVAAIDYSDYQGASIIHDMNQPISADWAQSFDTVVDGGSLEHIFDIKRALANEMEMLKVGGHLFVLVPANNMCGHGFYQFSPEFFYRAFDQTNGFAVQEVVLIELPASQLIPGRWRTRMYRALDPMSLGRRVEFANDRPLLMFIHAQRINAAPPFAEAPVQSDYSAKWQRHSARSRPKRAEITPFRRSSVRKWVKSVLKGRSRRRRSGLRDRSAFTPLK